MLRRGTTLLLATLLFLSGFSSCMTTRTSVGQFKELPGEEYKYDKGKQFWLFAGLLPLGRTDVSAPASGDCEVITRYTIGDMAINILTLGFLHSYTIKVMAKRVPPATTDTINE